MVLIKTHRDTLLAPLQSVSGIVERRHTLPILSNVLLEKRGDKLTLLATDIEIQITTATTGAGGEGDGAVTVGARKLQEILRSLPDANEVRRLPAHDHHRRRDSGLPDYAKGFPPVIGQDPVQHGCPGCALLPERFVAVG